MKKLLFLGDVVGAPGRDALKALVPGVRAGLGLDFVVVNAENAAAGSGLTKALALELLAGGADALTLGDHVWDQKQFERELPALERVCRPANLPSAQPGRDRLILADASGFRLLVFTVLGRNFIGPKADCPFLTADRVLAESAGQFDAALVEIHAEATSEKVALGHHLAGRASVVVGTHTHVPTADACVLPGGTAYQTDAGMCGPYDGVIGREKGAVIGRFLDGMPRPFPVASGDVRLSGLLVSLDTAGRALAAERFEAKHAPGPA